MNKLARCALTVDDTPRLAVAVLCNHQHKAGAPQCNRLATALRSGTLGN